MFNFFANIFGYILKWIYLLVKNYGLAIIIFSVLVKIVMLPISIRQQKTMKKNEKIQKELKILQIKHKGNPERLNQETMELYKRENVNPFGGCFTIIIQFILLISMFYLVKSPLTYMQKIDSNIIENEIIEIKKVNGEDSISQGYPEMSVIKYLKQNNDTENQMYINMDFLGLDLSKVPQENFGDWKVFVIPVLYVISSILSIKMTTNMTNKKKEEKEKNKEEKALLTEENKAEMDQEEMTAQMNKSMSLMMPILSVSVSLIAPLGLSLYWLINNIIMMIERLMLNKLFSKEEEENV